MARNLGLEQTVIFTGFVPDADLTYLYNVADVYIGAGVAELQGIAVMEAMACCCPLIPGISEVTRSLPNCPGVLQALQGRGIVLAALPLADLIGNDLFEEGLGCWDLEGLAQ